MLEIEVSLPEVHRMLPTAVNALLQHWTQLISSRDVFVKMEFWPNDVGWVRCRWTIDGVRTETIHDQSRLMAVFGLCWAQVAAKARGLLTASVRHSEPWLCRPATLTIYTDSHKFRELARDLREIEPAVRDYVRMQVTERNPLKVVS